MGMRKDMNEMVGVDKNSAAQFDQAERSSTAFALDAQARSAMDRIRADYNQQSERREESLQDSKKDRELEQDEGPEFG